MVASGNLFVRNIIWYLLIVEIEKPLCPAVGPGGLKVVDQVAREESFLGKVSRLANTSKRVAGADGG